MALIVSGRLFGRESDSGSDWEWLALPNRVRQRLGLRVVGSSEESQTAAWIREVVDSLREGQTAAPLNKSDNSRYLETVKYVEH